MSNDKKVGLLDVINSDMLQLNVNANLPKEVIEIASRPLIDKNTITKSYVQKVLDRDYNDFIIAPGIALPHSAPLDGVKNIGMSITCLKYPCEFGDKFDGKVKYIFMLATIDNSTHLGILEDLMQIITDKNFFLCLQSGNKSEVIEYLKRTLS